MIGIQECEYANRTDHIVHCANQWEWVVRIRQQNGVNWVMWSASDEMDQLEQDMDNRLSNDVSTYANAQCKWPWNMRYFSLIKRDFVYGWIDFPAWLSVSGWCTRSRGWVTGEQTFGTIVGCYPKLCMFVRTISSNSKITFFIPW